MRLIFKTIVYVCVYALSRVVAVFKQKEPSAIILMYHSFDDTTWKYGVRPKELEKQIAYLAKRKRVVPLEEVVAFVRGDQMSPSPHPSPAGGGSPLSLWERAGVRVGPHTHNHTPVAITVDDVYEDTYTVLFPLLKKYRIPATLFLTTDLSPREKLGNLLRSTWTQLREMQDSGLVTVEVHGRTHVNWTEVENDPSRLRDEVLGAREDIIRELGYTPRFAAYPAGHRSKHLEAYLRDNGFEAGVAISQGGVRPGDNLYALRRVQVDKTMSVSLFRARLSTEVLRLVALMRSV